MGHTFFHTSLHLLAQQHVGWANLGILPQKNPPHTHNQAAHHSAQALFQKPPCWLGQSERSLPPPPWDCHHLFDTMSGGCALRSWPETTIHRRAASVLCKPLWHHQAKGTPEVLTQSKGISNTRTRSHTHLHADIIKPVGFGGLSSYVVCLLLLHDCLVIISTLGLGLFHCVHTWSLQTC